MFSIGTSPQGRSIECLVVASRNEFTPAKARRSGKAVVLIQNGIHAGEIEGKDASMLLLREILVTKEKFHLLDNLILLVIPVLSVDGHERISPFNRPNQNGPAEMGWRTNSWNLNLNRDYLKAETPEIRSVIALIESWRPDFFIDNHTTNGADYRYHISYALEKGDNIDQSLGWWGSDQFIPFMVNAVEKQGFLTAPYIVFKSGTIESGIVDTPAIPRLSTGYMAVQNRLGLLVETHSLKPFHNRVYSTLAMNSATLEYLSQHRTLLKKMNRQADERAKKLTTLPLKFELSDHSEPFVFKGLDSHYEASSITGGTVIRYGTTPKDVTIPYFNRSVITKQVTLPKGYVIPMQFRALVETLRLHGVEVKQLTKKKIVTVEEYRFTDAAFASKPYEGRYCVEVRCSVERTTMDFPPGTFYISMNQRTNRVIANLLEPEGPDSFISWGYFNAFFERKEYAEAYVMEPIAQQMLSGDAALQKEFAERLHEERFRNDPDARLDFFYRRSPYFDIHERKYPIYRIV